MKHYLDYVLASYYGMATELSADEAEAQLLTDMKNNVELNDGLIADLQEAFADPSYPWKEKFDEYDVFDANNEDHARKYASLLFKCFLKQ